MFSKCVHIGILHICPSSIHKMQLRNVWSEHKQTIVTICGSSWLYRPDQGRAQAQGYKPKYLPSQEIEIDNIVWRFNSTTEVFIHTQLSLISLVSKSNAITCNCYSIRHNNQWHEISLYLLCNDPLDKYCHHGEDNLCSVKYIHSSWQSSITMVTVNLVN